ncbi:Glycerol uptake protein [Pseudohyphozyma bogoriensis]|nr:Glycerol uptake protein [Pseudohyphozyma bogoriensis]
MRVSTLLSAAVLGATLSSAKMQKHVVRSSHADTAVAHANEPRTLTLICDIVGLILGEGLCGTNALAGKKCTSSFVCDKTGNDGYKTTSTSTTTSSSPSATPNPNWPSSDFVCDGTGNDGWSYDPEGNTLPWDIPYSNGNWLWFGSSCGGWLPEESWNVPSADYELPADCADTVDLYDNATWWVPRCDWILPAGWWPAPFWITLDPTCTNDWGYGQTSTTQVTSTAKSTTTSKTSTKTTTSASPTPTSNNWPSQDWVCDYTGNDGSVYDYQGNTLPWDIPYSNGNWLWFGETCGGWLPEESWNVPSADYQLPSDAENTVDLYDNAECGGKGNDGWKYDWQGNSCPSTYPSGFLWFGTQYGWLPPLGWGVPSTTWSPYSGFQSDCGKATWWAPSRTWQYPSTFVIPSFWVSLGWTSYLWPVTGWNGAGTGKDGWSFDYNGNSCPSTYPSGFLYFGSNYGWLQPYGWTIPSATWVPTSVFQTACNKATWWYAPRTWQYPTSFQIPSFWVGLGFSSYLWPLSSFVASGSGLDGWKYDAVGNTCPSSYPSNWLYFGAAKQWHPPSGWTMPSNTWSPPAAWNPSQCTCSTISQHGITSLTVDIPASSSSSKDPSPPPPSRWRTKEFCFYYAVFLLVVPRMAWVVIQLSSESHPNYPRFAHRLRKGWLFGWKVDVSDHQWSLFRGHLPLLFLLSSVYILLSRVTLPSSPTAAQKTRFILAFTLPLIILLHGTSAPKMMVILAANYSIAKLAKTKGSVGRWVPLLGWAFNLVVLFANELAEGYQWSSLSSSLAFLDRESLKGILPRWHINWNITMLRLISFNMDYYWAVNASPSSPDPSSIPNPTFTERSRASTSHLLSEYSFTSYILYTLYPPLYLAGPIITFNSFISQLHNPPSIPRSTLFRYTIRFLVCLLTMEFVGHTMYVVAIKDESRAGAWKGDSPWELSMIGFWNLIVVWLKLLIPWRFFRLWALLDGIEPPENMVRCMANNYSTSGFWRSWHRSYNLWVVRYLYVPIGGASNGILATLVVFTFVALWHDLSLKLLTWGWVISLFVIPEMLGRKFVPYKAYGGQWWYRHLAAAGGVANILMMMTANLIGFAIGTEGMAYMWGAMVGTWAGIKFMIVAVGCLFVAVQVMFEYRMKISLLAGLTLLASATSALPSGEKRDLPEFLCYNALTLMGSKGKAFCSSFAHITNPTSTVTPASATTTSKISTTTTLTASSTAITQTAPPFVLTVPATTTAVAYSTVTPAPVTYQPNTATFTETSTIVGEPNTLTFFDTLTTGTQTETISVPTDATTITTSLTASFKTVYATPSAMAKVKRSASLGKLADELEVVIPAQIQLFASSIISAACSSYVTPTSYTTLTQTTTQTVEAPTPTITVTDFASTTLTEYETSTPVISLTNTIEVEATTQATTTFPSATVVVALPPLPTAFTGYFGVYADAAKTNLLGYADTTSYINGGMLITTDLSDALKVSGNVGSGQNLQVADGGTHMGYSLIGAANGPADLESYGWALVAGVAATSGGSAAVPRAGSGSAKGYSTNVWTIGTDGSLTIVWTNSPGYSPATTVASSVYGPQQNGLEGTYDLAAHLRNVPGTRAIYYAIVPEITYY